MQLEAGQDPITTSYGLSTKYWRAELTRIHEGASENLRLAERTGLAWARARWQFATSIDRAAIKCILDRQGRYQSNEGDLFDWWGTFSTDSGGEHVLWESGHRYTFSPEEFPEWHELVRLKDTVEGMTGIPSDLDDRLERLMRAALARYEEALKAIGS